MGNKKVLVINDIAGAGKVAGNINLPILSAAGFETAILPTLLLSNNTEYDQGTMVSFPIEEAYKGIIEQWMRTDLNFSGMLSGYFGSTQQIDLLRVFYDDRNALYPETKLFIDPIMGDRGELYHGFDERVPTYFAQLLEVAYMVIPNLTEASFILGRPYQENYSDEYLLEIARGLQNMGAKKVALSGIASSDGIGFFVLDEDGSYAKVLHTEVEGHYFGTGDMAASLLMAYDLQGYSLTEAAQRTGDFIANVLRNTKDLNRDIQLGVYFEDQLFTLKSEDPF